MKYFCVSDIHGCYDLLMQALNDAGFNKEQDILVVVGDSFDRGSQSHEVLEYILSCPNRILLMGNHDLRLMQLLRAPYDAASYDISNGVPQTLVSLLQGQGMETKGVDFYAALYKLKHHEHLQQLFKESVAAVEFPDLIITHGWLPTNDAMGPRTMELLLNWREAGATYWEDALWANTEIILSRKLFPEKPMLIGHWHAWRLAEKYGEKRQTNKHDDNQYINCDMYQYFYKDILIFTAIDGCSNWPNGGKVNCYVFESDAEPIKYDGGFRKWYYWDAATMQ